MEASAVGRTWPAVTYEVGVEKIREYAHAISAAEPVHHDREAARAAGFRDVVAPPMFAVVYSTRALAPAVLDPDVGIDLARMLHGGQEFVWGEPVCAGDVIETEAKLLKIDERDGRRFYVFESRSRNQDGAEVARGTWTNIVR